MLLLHLRDTRYLMFPQSFPQCSLVMLALEHSSGDEHNGLGLTL